MQSPVIERNGKLLFLNERGQVVGEWRDGWLVKKVNPLVHQLRKPPSWAVDIKILTALSYLSASGIRLELPDGTMLEADLTSLEKYGIDIERGHGHQVALPLRYWRRKDV